MKLWRLLLYVVSPATRRTMRAEAGYNVNFRVTCYLFDRCMDEWERERFTELREATKITQIAMDHCYREMR